MLRMVRNEALLLGRRKRPRPAAGNLCDIVTRRSVDELEREETHRQVWSALRTLPNEQAEVVVLKIWEGMTFAQIGQILETSANTAASRYQYAISKLSRRLSQPYREVHRD
jgi:RNA polymerase sigma-70 factor (ECF subfamily)